MNPLTAWMLLLSTLHLELATGYTEWADWLIDTTEV
jgi:hypothetical protein